MPALPHQFAFAGFSWPRYVARMPGNGASLAARLIAARAPRMTGEYYHAPEPGAAHDFGFYLMDAGMPCRRYDWAGHEFHCEDGMTSIRGIILFLPHGRFLAGSAMGERMAASVGRKRSSQTKTRREEEQSREAEELMGEEG